MKIEHRLGEILDDTENRICDVFTESIANCTRHDYEEVLDRLQSNLETMYVCQYISQAKFGLIENMIQMERQKMERRKKRKWFRSPEVLDDE